MSNESNITMFLYDGHECRVTLQNDVEKLEAERGEGELSRFLLR